jgi:hypothetical protein
MKPISIKMPRDCAFEKLGHVGLDCAIIWCLPRLVLAKRGKGKQHCLGQMEKN